MSITLVKVKWIKITEKPGSSSYKKAYFAGEREEEDYYGYVRISPASEPENVDEREWVATLVEQFAADKGVEFREVSEGVAIKYLSPDRYSEDPTVVLPPPPDRVHKRVEKVKKA